MSTAKFSVIGKLDGAGGMKTGTLSIDRATGEVIVRPKGSRTVYRSTLAVFATWVCVAELKAAMPWSR